MEARTDITDETNNAIRAARERLRALDRKLEQRWTENRDQQASMKARNGTVSEAVKEMIALHATRERLRAVNEKMDKREISVKQLETLCKSIEEEFLPMINKIYETQENVILRRIQHTLSR
jgi:phage shock protein A